MQPSILQPEVSARAVPVRGLRSEQALASVAALLGTPAQPQNLLGNGINQRVAQPVTIPMSHLARAHRADILTDAEVQELRQAVRAAQAQDNEVVGYSAPILMAKLDSLRQKCAAENTSRNMQELATAMALDPMTGSGLLNIFKMRQAAVDRLNAIGQEKISPLARVALERFIAIVKDTLITVQETERSLYQSLGVDFSTSPLCDGLRELITRCEADLVGTKNGPSWPLCELLAVLLATPE
jgi:hypothetical protein